MKTKKAVGSVKANNSPDLPESAAQPPAVTQPPQAPGILDDGPSQIPQITAQTTDPIPEVAPNAATPGPEVTTTGATSSVPRTSYKFGDTISTPPLHQGRVIKNLWQVCCNEVGTEMKELNSILNKLGLPPVNYSKDKTYPLIDYEEAPHLENSKSKDFLDFWVFPILLPAVQSLIEFAKINRVFQCRYCSFNSLDYIVEYLYNNNPRYPYRLENPTPLFQISFVKKWLAKYPRPPLPKWLTMTDSEAATIIQRNVRGFLVRIRPDVQEVRQFWKDFKKDAEAEKSQKDLEIDGSGTELFSPYYSELLGEFDNGKGELGSDFHSDACLICSRFKEFLQNQRLLKQKTASSYPGESAGSDFYEDDLDNQDMEKLSNTAIRHSKNANNHHQNRPANPTGAVPPNKVGSGDNLGPAGGSNGTLKPKLNSSLASIVKK